MIRRIPILPTLLVLLAVAYMIRLGFWQIDRLRQKEGLLAQYAAAAANPAPVAYPLGGKAAVQASLYRRAKLDCRFREGEWESVGGRNAKGEPGYVQIAPCDTGAGATAYVQIGWSRDPAPPQWAGGMVSGFIAPYKVGGARLVADPPLAGLQANARPDPGTIANNHLAYAVQWFLFAAVALIIYALALRSRLATPRPRD